MFAIRAKEKFDKFIAGVGESLRDERDSAPTLEATHPMYQSEASLMMNDVRLHRKLFHGKLRRAFEGNDSFGNACNVKGFFSLFSGNT